MENSLRLKGVPINDGKKIIPKLEVNHGDRFDKIWWLHRFSYKQKTHREIIFNGNMLSKNNRNKLTLKDAQICTMLFFCGVIQDLAKRQHLQHLTIWTILELKLIG